MEGEVEVVEVLGEDEIEFLALLALVHAGSELRGVHDRSGL